ncbi:hypothetical protein Pelo_3065 [Pelomyxa schiedti]|nr:hypothetical protein Pelo_3065 [Pelomyxa schiedti]
MIRKRDGAYSGTGTTAWVVCASKVLWSVALLPHTCLIPWNSVDEYLEDQDEQNLGTLLHIAEAFFPLVALAGKKAMALTNGCVLRFCAIFGCRRVPEWILSHFPEDETPVESGTASRCFVLLIYSCVNGRMDYVRWVVSKFPVSSEEMASAFVTSCHRGQMEVCKFLVEKYGLMADHVIRSDPAIKGTIERGYLDMFQWLVSTYGLTRNNFTKYFASLLRQVFETGNLAFAEWFCTQFEVDQNDTWEILCGIMKTGSLQMVKWFTAKFEYPWRSASSYFIQIANTSHPDFVEWLCDTFPRSCDELLKPACSNGHIDSVKLLCEKVSFDSSSVWFPFVASLQNGFLEIAKYLETKYGPLDPTGWGLAHPLHLMFIWGNVDTVKWVTTKYPPLMKVEPSVLLHSVTNCAREKNTIPFLQWLFEERNLDPVSSLHDAQNKVFRLFCENGYLDVLKWFLAKGYITPTDLQLPAAAEEPGKGPCTPLEIFTSNRNLAAIQWVSVNYPEIAQSQAVACIRRACADAHTPIARFLLKRYSPTVQELCRDPPCVMKLTDDPVVLDVLTRFVGAHTHD